MLPLTLEVTQYLQGLLDGNAPPDSDLFAAVYQELHQIAVRNMRQERDGHTLQPTALVSEAFLRLIQQGKVVLADRSHFLALATTVMRRVLVDHARKRHSERRGGDWLKVSLDDQPGQDFLPYSELDEQLQVLEKVAPRKAMVLQLRYFGGLTIEEIAAVLDLASPTIYKELNLARGWLSARIVPHQA